MDFSPMWRWLKGDMPPVDPTDQLIARQVFADYMRAQILGFRPDATDAMLAALTVEANGKTEPAPFPDLMGVETQLAGALSDDMVDQTYWIVRERFNRIAPDNVIEEHSRWAPPGLVEPDERIPVGGVPTPPEGDPPVDQTDDAPEDPAVDQAGPVIDPVALDTDAAAREAEARHEQALDLESAVDDPADDAQQDDPSDALDPPAGPLREEQ